MTTEPFPSRGHGAGRYTLELRVSPESREAYVALMPGTTLPNGALIAAFHRESRLGQPGPIYTMEKRGDAWSFRVYGPDGIPAEAGLTELCARCHAESPTDQLFGLPRALRP